uniref:Uncharacterized protein n=1 Tax=Magnetococcus massalia (strain MO-1) TaxID=451514 RepID=A0A1S7LGI5_MAGMO|nr:protein of unknown function [Candidatus Magnetococcus massalia]
MYPLNSAIPFTLPVIDWIFPVPNLKEPPLFFADRQPVSRIHVKIGPSDIATHFGAGFNTISIPVNLKVTSPVSSEFISNHRERAIAAVAIQFAHCWNQVVEVRLHRFEDGINLSATSTAFVDFTFLGCTDRLSPALTGMSKGMGWNDMFPFNATAPLGTLARLIAACSRPHIFVSCIAATTVEGCMVPLINLG